MIDVQLYIYITKPEESRQLGRIGSDQLPLLAQVLVVHVPRQAVLEPDKRYIHLCERAESLKWATGWSGEKLKSSKNLKVT